MAQTKFIPTQRVVLFKSKAQKTFVLTPEFRDVMARLAKARQDQEAQLRTLSQMRSDQAKATTEFENLKMERQAKRDGLKKLIVELANCERGVIVDEDGNWAVRKGYMISITGPVIHLLNKIWFARDLIERYDRVIEDCPESFVKHRTCIKTTENRILESEKEIQVLVREVAGLRPKETASPSRPVTDLLRHLAAARENEHKARHGHERLENRRTVLYIRLFDIREAKKMDKLYWEYLESDWYELECGGTTAHVNGRTILKGSDEWKDRITDVKAKMDETDRQIVAYRRDLKAVRAEYATFPERMAHVDGLIEGNERRIQDLLAELAGLEIVV